MKVHDEDFDLAVIVTAIVKEPKKWLEVPILDFIKTSDVVNEVTLLFNTKIPDPDSASVELKLKILILQSTIIARIMNKVPQLYQDVQRSISKLSNELGLSKSRIFPIEPKKIYLVITERVSYKISYDENEIFTITVAQGEGAVPPTFPLRFVGNVQLDGTIFEAGNLPIFSTGDNLLFSNAETGALAFMTSRVQAVIDEAAVN